MQSETTSNSNYNPVAHKIMTVVGTILCLLLTPILVINCTLIVKSYTNKDAVPSFGGMMPMIILTDSMYPEIEAGDLIICKETTPLSVQVGDIICFFDPAGNGTSTVTHRVMEVSTDDNGGLCWITKGDANNAEDQVKVPADKLVGMYSLRIAGAGNIAMFMQTTQGLIICVVCPILLLIAYDVMRRKMYERKNQSDTDALMAELAALRAEKENKK